MSLKNSRLCEDVFEHGVHLLGRGFHHVWASNYVAKSRADALQVKGLELLGHILDFATFHLRLSSRGFTSKRIDRPQHGR
jgi:hypothetical protein